jgi:mannose-6-phosphate isomerase-like protein (cupin superfamily)
MVPFDIHEAAAAVSGPYENRVIARTNDQVVRMSVMTGPFYWHRHPNSDETFLTLEGAVVIDFADRSVSLAPGQILTVPAGVVHRTRPERARSVNISVERADTETEPVDLVDGPVDE